MAQPVFHYIHPLTPAQIEQTGKALVNLGWVGGVVHAAGCITAHTKDDPMRVVVGDVWHLNQLSTISEAYERAAANAEA